MAYNNIYTMHSYQEHHHIKIMSISNMLRKTKGFKGNFELHFLLSWAFEKDSIFF